MPYRITRTTDYRVFSACEDCGDCSPRVTVDSVVYRWQRAHRCDPTPSKEKP